MSVRLDSYLSQFGFCARRKVDEFILTHQIEVNSVRIKEKGFRVDPQKDVVCVDGKNIQETQTPKVYYLVYKPKKYVSSVSDELGRRTVLSLLPKEITSEYRLYPVGRLDADSHGLVLLTNDGDLTYKATHPKYHIPKTYKLRIASSVSQKALHLLQSGVRLKRETTSPSQVEILENTSKKSVLRITIFEGKNRQIRRMCKALNLNLIDLERVAIGNLSTSDLENEPFKKIPKPNFAGKTINKV